MTEAQPPPNYTAPPPVHLDTHAAIMLWEGRDSAFGPRSRRLLEIGALAVSPAVRMELQFLRELGRLTVDPRTILNDLGAECAVRVTDEPFHRTVSAAMGVAWTRDPFDRLIVASALVHGAHLVTRDREITENCESAVW